MSFHTSRVGSNAQYMHKTIDLLTRLAESAKPKARPSLGQTNAGIKESGNKDKENNQQRRGSEAQKQSILTGNSPTVLMLKNVVDCNDSEEDPTMDSNAFLQTGEARSSERCSKRSGSSSRFQTPEQSKHSRSSSRKRKGKNTESQKKINTSSISKRLYEHDKKLREKKEDMRKKFLEEEKQTMRANPQINERSKQLRGGSGNEGQKPLFLRISEVQRKKKEEIEKMKQVLESQRKEKEPEPTFVPDLSHTRRKEVKSRTVSEFLSSLGEWEKRKRENCEKTHIEMLTEEMRQNTFHPEINKTSKKLARERKEHSPSKRKCFKQDPALTFHPRIDPKSRQILLRKGYSKKRLSFMDPTLHYLNRVNENRFDKIVRKMSLDPDSIRLLSTTFMASKKEYFEGKSRMKRGRSVCFMQTLQKGERKVKEMEDIFDKRTLWMRNLNRVEYDKSLRFMVEMAKKKKY